MDVLMLLQQWYTSQCNGEWEHQYGVRIETLDNPGWLVRIDVVGTALEDRPFTEVAEGVGRDKHPDKTRWMHCSLRDKTWEGAGDETQLTRLLRIFLDWAKPDVEQSHPTGPAGGPV